MIPLSRPYSSIYGTPVLTSADPVIFTARYFRHCMACGFCHDSCCAYGEDVSADDVARILAHADGLEARVGIPRQEWFEPDFRDDPEYPSGRFTRTRVRDGACVFVDRKGRGCLLHSHALAEGLDYHRVKPMIGALFPLTFDRGLLRASYEIGARELVCMGQGPTLYEGARDELRHYFGPALVAELDGVVAG